MMGKLYVAIIPSWFSFHMAFHMHIFFTEKEK